MPQKKQQSSPQHPETGAISVSNLATLEKINLDLTKRLKQLLTYTSTNPDDRGFFPHEHPVVRGYLAKLRAWHGYARFIGLPALVETSKDVPLERLYVLPHVAAGHIAPEALSADAPPNTSELIPALREHLRLVVLGDPGSGKSTLINFICDSFARPVHTDLKKEIAPDLIPLPMILRELGVDEHVTWDKLRDAFLQRPVGQALGPDELSRRQMFDTLLQTGQGWVLLDGVDEIGSMPAREAVRQAYSNASTSHPTTRFLITSRVVGYDDVPFDGLYVQSRTPDGKSVHVRLRPDGSRFGQITNQDGEAEITGVFPSGLRSPDDWPFSEVKDKAASLIRFLSEPEEDIRKVGGIQTQRLFLSPFDDAQVNQFTRNWWMHHRGNPALAAAEADEFLRALRENPATHTLGRVPNLLVLVALVFKVFVKLPDGRAALYWKIAEAYLENIDRHYKLQGRLPYSFEQMARWLARVAWHMQMRRDDVAKSGSDGASDANELLLTEDEATTCLAGAIRDLEGKTEQEALGLATTFLDYAARRSGLFIPRGQHKETGKELYAFMHLSFQEFFAAVYLADAVGRSAWWKTNVWKPGDKSETSLPKLREYACRIEWTEVFLFAFELVKAGDQDRPRALLWVLLGESNEDNTELQPFDARFDGPLLRKPFNSSSDAKRQSKSPQQHEGPRIPHGRLVELAARVAMDSEVPLGRVRAHILTRCWEWETRRSSWGAVEFLGNRNFVAKILLAARDQDTSKLVWEAFQSGAVGCTNLDFSGCTGLTDLSPLANLKDLHFLSLAGCSGISDLSPLNGLKKLELLNLASCVAVHDIAPIANLRSIWLLIISRCPAIKDLSAIAYLRNLQFLRLQGCTAVNDITPLFKTRLLRQIDLNGCTALTTDQINAFKATHPKCELLEP